MSKKKHQGEPNDDDSTESCDENLNNVVECIHINKSVDLQKIKKTLIKTGFLNDCEECKNSPLIEQDNEMELEFDTSLWMCLKCGNQACGREKNKHALKHFETPHSDKHSLCVNTTVWLVWCYECDHEINITCKKKLLEAVEYLRKNSESNNKYNIVNTRKSLEMIALPEPPLAIPVNKLHSHPLGSLPRARGLTNLGNTCFFNSVMQCLGQTPYLLELLSEEAESGQKVTLPGGTMTTGNKETIDLEPIEGELGKWKTTTNVLADTLRELQSGRAEVYSPRLLLSRLTARMPQFGGGDQHDSHELLRHLLEAVREEDIKRYHALIIEKKGLKDVDSSTVSDEEKKILKFYAQQAEALLPTEQVFRGVLVSTLQCQECCHTSHRDEYFLDLSLPVAEKQVPPILRRKAEEIDDKPSKHQIKKEKRAERKKNKKQKSHRNLINSVDSTLILGDTNMEKSDSESDADVEDNVEEPAWSKPVDDAPVKGVESGYNSDKVYTSSPDSNNRGASPDIHIDDSGVPSPAVGGVNVSPSGLSRLFSNSPSSSETNYADMGSPLCGHNSPIEEDMPDDMERPESRLSFRNNRGTDLKVGLEKLILNDGDSNKVNYLCNENPSTSTYERSLNQEDEKMDDEEPEDANMWTSTFSTKYQCEEGECSVQSCLNQFTAWELLNGYNKVACDLCTKRHGGPENKTQYNNATKQLLIYNPPAVLILHLKRFQVYRYRSAKVSKYVKFPTLLDIGPFCSKRSKNLPTFEDGQSKILYSLYGVVEHGGSIHGGHYVSYVKVRSQLDKSSYRWNFLPRNQGSKKQNVPIGEPEIPTGKWYYISDSFVSEVTEAKVLDAQAYLLFYERIM